MKIIPPFSALRSWEAYDYQGHIALYIALKKIHDIINNGDDINKYQLQIEGEEDFALLKDNDYISLHQVKAGGVDLKDNDKFVFIIEIAEKNGAKGYFHINNTVQVNSDFCEKAFKISELVLSDLSKNVIQRKDLRGRSEDDFIICEEVRKQHKKGSAYDLIKYSILVNYKNDNSVKNVIDAVDKISKELKIYKNEIKKDIDSNAPNSPDIKYYSIYPERFDSNKEIKQQAATEIINILSIVNPKCSGFAKADYGIFVYEKLFMHMKNVFDDHLDNKSNNDRCLISFDEIFNVITQDYPEELNSPEYQYYIMLRRMVDAFDEYQDSHSGKCPSQTCDCCVEKDTCNLRNQIDEIINKDFNEIFRNLIMFTPDHRMTFNPPEEELISDLFIDLLKEIQSLKLTDRNVFLAESRTKEIYRATLIDTKLKRYFERKYSEYINNSSDRSLLYEADVLITENLNDQGIVFNESNFNVLSEKEINELLAKDIISTSIEEIRKGSFKPKVIRLVDKKTAIGDFS